MMGTSLNTSSSAAREMDMVLKSEISAHSAYDPATKPGNHGVPVPGKKQVRLKIFVVIRKVEKILKGNLDSIPSPSP